MSKRTSLDGKEHSKVLFHPYTRGLANQLEVWLTKVSIDGWKLIDNKGWRFYFIKCKEGARQYFEYDGFDSTMGFSHDFFRAKAKYSKSKPIIFKRTYSIFEVDPRKIDDDFFKYRILRNKFYRIHYIKLGIFCLINISISCIGSFYTPSFLLVVGVPHMLLFVYAITSIISLTHFIEKDKETVGYSRITCQDKVDDSRRW